MMEFAAIYKESSMRFCMMNANANSGEPRAWDEMESMGQDSDESKTPVEYSEDSHPFSLRNEAVSKLSDEGKADAGGQVSETDTGGNRAPSMKRPKKETSQEESESPDLKKSKKKVTGNGSPSGESASAAVADDSERGKMSDDDDVIMLDAGVMPATQVMECLPNENEEAPLGKMLGWLIGVAKDDHRSHPAGDSTPESSSERKQVLLAREALSVKRYDDATEQSNWQKLQKMHPLMYEDHAGTIYNLRDRIRGKWTQSSWERSSNSDTSRTKDHLVGGEGGSDESIAYSSIHRLPGEVGVGPQYQAEVRTWDGVAYESDPKWLGDLTWPPEQTEHTGIIERDPIGKGREDSCGCQVRGSLECVGFHIAEKGRRLNVELGSAFHLMKLDKMGEKVEEIDWTAEETEKFSSILNLKPRSFWDEMCNYFPRKSMKKLVSYYFNVYHVKRRAYQIRYDRDNIDSDEDEL
ncbi:hypothetical protein SAY86_004303 [Trapa natans]|uniref:ELM2 domain-containing protein n=1 Tax=Trapa natans TaxID=22666 RepID=A0AAN7N3Z1_TRANT|nr:hypothetical protein SAY86_004303 [Trapa natans]